MELDAESIIQNALDKAVSILSDKPLHAEVILGQLLKAVPDHPKGTHLMGLVKQRMGRHEEAIEFISKAMSMDPENPDNYNNLALSYANLDDYEKAIEYLEKAISKSPNHHIYLSNLALQYRQRGEFERSKDLFERALLAKSSPEIWCNLGGLYHDWRKYDRSVQCFETAISLDAGCAAAHVNLALALCALGDFERGLTEYEWRFDHFPQLQHYKKVYDKSRLWDGEDLNGKRILLYGEQGYGDTIQFARYIPFLKQMGAHVILHAHAPLAPFLSKAPGVDETFVGDIDKLALDSSSVPEYDYQCSIISLPYILKKFELCGSPYLCASSRLNLKATEEYGKTFNIGISWAGSPAHPNDEYRSIFLKEFLPLTKIPGVKLYSLQVGGCKRAYTHGKRIVDYSEGAEGMNLVDLTPEIKTFEDTAAVVSGLDLIVCVDTSLAHLAGSLGKPCWVLIPYIPDWRWGIDGDKTGWYDSLRLYRQSYPKDWSHVVERIRLDVEGAMLLQAQ